MTSSNTQPVVVFDLSSWPGESEYLPLVEVLRRERDQLDFGELPVGRINPLDGWPARAEKSEQLIAGLARAQSQESLWTATADGTDAVATRDAITWALARVQLAGEPITVTSVLAHLPQTSAVTS